MTRLARRWWPRAEPLLILAVLLGLAIRAAPGIALHPDESQRIYSSRILEAFVDGRFDSPLFGSTFFTRTVMPVPQYLIGLGRWTGGASLDDLAAPWNFSRTHDENAARGAVPSAHLLTWSRAPMAVLAALCGLLVFSLGRRMGGRLSGYVALALFAFNPYVENTLCLAMAEAPLVASILAAMWIAAWTLERIRVPRGGPATGWGSRVAPLLGCIALGVAAGLAGASKLNGASTVAAAALLLLMVPLVDDGRLDVARTRLALAAAITSFATGLFTFFALNPFFYRNPARRISELIPALLNSLERLRADGRDDIIAPDERLGVLAERVFQSFAALSFPHAALLNAALCAIGLVAILAGVRGWLRGRGEGPAGATCTAFSVIAVFTVVPTLTTPLDWERYYILPVLFSTLCIAHAVGVIVARGRALARSRTGVSVPGHDDRHSPVRGG